MVKEKVDPISQIHSLNAGKVLLNSRNAEIHVMSSPKIELYEIAHVDLTLGEKGVYNPPKIFVFIYW